MDRFFDERADSYDEHMRAELERFDAFYAAVADSMPVTDEPIEILDLGIGTGLELPGILSRAPRATITGIDVSEGMLDRLRAKFPDASKDLRLIHGSFLEVDLGEAAYDIVISTMALHHWLPDRKLSLYRRIGAALRLGGLFVNGDYVEDSSTTSPLPTCPGSREGNGGGLVHVDHPLTIQEELGLLSRSGFGPVRVAFRTEHAAVLVARR